MALLTQAPGRKSKVSNGTAKYLKGETFHPMNDLQIVLKKERARADRTGLPFSQILLECKEISSAFADNLVRVIYSRIRLTDEIKWVGNRTIAIVLPDTPSEGARALANSILDLLNPYEESLACKVYTYPSTRSTNGI